MGMKGLARTVTGFEKKTLADWEKLAARDLAGKPADSLAWTTPEGIRVKPLYTAADLEGLEHLGTLPGFPPYLRGPRATMYAGRPWTIRQYAGFSTAEESNAFYRKNLAAGPEGAFHRLRSCDPSRLRFRSSPRDRRCRQGGRGHRQRRGYEDPVRRHPAGSHERVDDDERRRAAGAGILHRRRRRTGRGPPPALRHDPERHPEGVHGPQHLHLPARTIHAHRRRHHRLYGGGDAEVQLHLDFRLSHAGGRRDRGAGTCLHHRRRHRICARGIVAGSGHRRVCAAAFLLLRHRHELLHGDRQAARRPPDLGETAAAVCAQGSGEFWRCAPIARPPASA